MFYGMGGWPGWWMPFMGMGMLLFWGAVIGLVAWIIRSSSHPNNSSTKSERPIEIAERLYAQGDITLQEFEEIRTNLRQVNPSEAGDALRSASRS